MKKSAFPARLPAAAGSGGAVAHRGRPGRVRRRQRPLAGCSVVVKHTSGGTVTGPDGRYEIGAAPGDTLRFSFVGFRTAEELVGRRTRIDVVLEAAAEAVFEECVVEVSGMQDAAGPVAGLSRRRAGSAALPFVQPGREEYAHYEENRFPLGPAGTAFDLLARSRRRLLCRLPPQTRLGTPSRAGCRAHRGAAELLFLRLSRSRGGRIRCRSSSMRVRVRGSRRTGWSASGCVPARFRPRRFRLRISSTS